MVSAPGGPGTRTLAGPTLGVALLALCACVPLPFGSVPCRVAVGGGQQWRPRSPDAPAEDLVQLRLGISALQLVPEMRDQPDVVAGVLLEHGRDDRHGAYAQAVFYPWARQLDNGRWLRLGVAGGVDWLLGAERGVAETLTLHFDYAGFSRGSFHSGPQVEDEMPGTLGASWGENGIGLYVSGGYRTVEGEGGWFLIAGAEVEIPAAVGVLLLPLWQ